MYQETWNKDDYEKLNNENFRLFLNGSLFCVRTTNKSLKLTVLSQLLCEAEAHSDEVSRTTVRLCFTNILRAHHTNSSTLLYVILEFMPIYKNNS